ncbi:MAG: phage GP46 family protein [Cloacibacillus sp.]
MLGGDIKITWNESGLCGDLSLDAPLTDISTDAGLETAVIISLFTDRRAAGEELPQNESSGRGWWGDSVTDVQNDKIGSKLWLLFREKQLTSVALRAKEYAEEALKWLIKDKIVKSINVVAEWHDGGLLALYVDITRPDGNNLKQRYNLNWKAQEVLRNGV